MSVVGGVVVVGVVVVGGVVVGGVVVGGVVVGGVVVGGVLRVIVVRTVVVVVVGELLESTIGPSRCPRHDGWLSGLVIGPKVPNAAHDPRSASPDGAAHPSPASS